VNTVIDLFLVIFDSIIIQMSVLTTTSNDLAQSGAIRESILDFQDFLSKEEGAFFGDSVHCPLKHSFADGIYVREIFIPAGTYIVGKIHKHQHPNFLLSGTVNVITEGGGEETLTGPLSIISPPGTKRALFSITDLVWVTVHHNPTNTQDLEKLEKIIIAESYDHYHKFKAVQEGRFVRSIKSIANIINKILPL
jgi:hypothetical protein